jgi:xylulose-5-phosphate/fructose-6-phosphate phosphoketolase
MDVADRVPRIAGRAAHLKQLMRDKRAEHKHYIMRHGEDMPEVRGWKWPY